MSSIPNLKKKLKSILATVKLSSAMKTVSAVKFSRLNSLFRTYKLYCKEFMFLYGDNFEISDSENECVIILSGNRGLCGGFNSEIIGYAVRELSKSDNRSYLIACGEQGIKKLEQTKYKPDKCFVFSDVPDFKQSEELYNFLSGLYDSGRISSVRIIYPEYKNTMFQIPTSKVLRFSLNDNLKADDTLFIPDKATVLSDINKKGFKTLLFGAILETAIGAQAATLMTMRSAYDTASDYSEALKKEIQRRRQSEVTADVIETSAEHTAKEEY